MLNIIINRLKCKMQEAVIDSEKLIAVSLGLVQFIPLDLFQELITHPLNDNNNT